VGDVEEITALVYRYAELLDGGDLEGVVRLFDGATWRSAATGEVRQTPEEVRAVYDRVILYEGTPRTRHLMTNLSIEFDDGGDAASGRCYFTVLQGVVSTEPIQTILAGRYHDRYRRTPEGWRFADRLFIIDLIGDQSRHFG
jgi:3-phenylpropionate/cinnamic acid dioxygenase small subunit